MVISSSWGALYVSAVQTWTLPITITQIDSIESMPFAPAGNSAWIIPGMAISNNVGSFTELKYQYCAGGSATSRAYYPFITIIGRWKQ